MKTAYKLMRVTKTGRLVSSFTTGLSELTYKPNRIVSCSRSTAGIFLYDLKEDALQSWEGNISPHNYARAELYEVKIITEAPTYFKTLRNLSNAYCIRVGKRVAILHSKKT